MPNHWIITKDFIGSKSKGIRSSAFPDNLSADDLPVTFQMYDDDKNLYVEGKMVREDFEPLDDYGMGGLGCTGVKTSVNGSQFEWL